MLESATSLSLLEQLRARPDEAAWRRFVALYTPLIQAWLRRHLLVGADSDDLLQEVLTVVLRELPHFEHNQRTGAFRCWLRAVVVHRLRNFWRARQARPQATGDSDFLARLDQLEDPASALTRLWDREHDVYVVRQLLATIQAEFQPGTWRAFEGVMLQGERPAEVAERLGVSVNAVLLAKSRVLRRLRQEGQGLIEV